VAAGPAAVGATSAGASREEAWGAAVAVRARAPRAQRRGSRRQAAGAPAVLTPRPGPRLPPPPPPAKPGLLDPKGRKKWDAWNSKKGAAPAVAAPFPSSPLTPPAGRAGLGRSPRLRARCALPRAPPRWAAAAAAGRARRGCGAASLAPPSGGRASGPWRDRASVSCCAPPNPNCRPGQGRRDDAVHCVSADGRGPQAALCPALRRLYAAQRPGPAFRLAGRPPPRAPATHPCHARPLPPPPRCSYVKMCLEKYGKPEAAPA
jgi:hypothetical protein